MSTTIDSRVVEMRFDNKNFESNVSSTMSTLDKLKNGLKLDGVGAAVETVGLKFNAMYTMADQALRDITSSVMSHGKRILSALTVDPIKTGLQEYETQINAVQTILANTESKGSTLNDVNKALDTLNTYADKTIYNFTEMTRNIGTFTAAGVDLDTSVNAIQGIANLAAVSGSTSQQASTAMYQLSQALSSGTVKLMDWNSVVNAGMGGQVFQDALKETARVKGVDIDGLIKKYGSFRETLQSGWLTADVLTETLSHFTMAAEEGSKQWKEYKKSLMDSGYSEEQANAILKMSNTATDAATKVKTATQLFDTLKETAQSGWTQTWEIIFGDFEEAKSLFSELYNTLAPILEATSAARNELLKGWKDDGGRMHIIESLRNVFEGIGNIVKPIKEAFREIFPPITVKQLLSVTEGLQNLTERFKNFFAEGSDNADNLKRTFKGLFAIVDIVKQAFVAVFQIVGPLFGKIGGLSGGLLDITASLGDWLVNLNESIKTSGLFTKVVESIHKAFAKVREFIQPVVDGIKKFGTAIGDVFVDISDNAKERLGPLAALGSFVKHVFIGLGNVLKKVAPYVAAAVSGIGSVLKSVMDQISSSIQDADYNGLFDTVNGGIISAIGIFIAKFVKSGSDILNSANSFMDNINGILEGAGDALSAFTESQKADTLKKIATAVAILAASLLVLALIPSEKLTSALTAITVLFGELLGSMYLFGKLGDMKDVIKIATAIVSLSAGLLVLSVALKILSTMSPEGMAVAIFSMVAGLASLIGSVKLLSMIKPKKLAKTTEALKSLAGSLVILSVAMKIMSTMSPEGMAVAIFSMVAGLAALIGTVKLLSMIKPGELAMTTKSIKSLASSLLILGVAMKIMSTMSWDDVGRSLSVLVGTLGSLVIAMRLMSNSLPGASAISKIAPALIVLAVAMHILGALSWDEIVRGLTTLAGSLVILAAAMALMKKSVAGATAISIITPALLGLAVAMKIMGSMSWDEIIRGLVLLAGAFVVIGVAAAVLGPLTPVIIILAKAISSLALACLLIGVGAMALGIGVTLIATALAAGGGAIAVFVSSLIGLIPYLIEQIGVGIIRLCEVIAGSAAAICEAIKVIILALVDTVVASAPAIVEGALVLITSLLEGLVTYLPQIVTLLVTLVVKLLETIVEQIPVLLPPIFEFLAALITGIADNITTLLDPLLELLSVIFQGIADVIGPVVETVIAPMLDVLSDLIVGLVKAIAPYIPNIQTMLGMVCEAFKLLLTNIVPILRSIVELIKQLGISISQILSSIADVIVSLAVVIGTALQGVADVIDSIAGVIKEALTGLSEIFDSVFNGIAEVVSSVGESIKSVLDGIAGVIDSIGTAALNAGTGFEKLANGVRTITNLGLADMVASLTAVASGIGDIAAHSSGIGTVGAGMSQISSSASTAASGVTSLSSGIVALPGKLASAKSGLDDLIQAFSRAGSDMTTAGRALIDNLASGITSRKRTAKTTVRSLVNVCSSVIRDMSGNFKSAGEYLGSGLVNGINAKQTAVYNAAYALGQKAVQGEKDGQQSNSPSKLTTLAGNWIGEGLIIGMNQMAGKVYKAGSSLGENATGVISSVISRIADTINTDIDAEPTIRPVLDLSDVRSGVGAISSMLDMNSSVGVLANVGHINSMMNNRSQNGANTEVVTAIDRLRKDLGKVGNTTYSINGITYDDGSNISNAMKVIVREARIERRR